MRRRLVLTVDIYAHDAAQANSQQEHLTWMIGGRAGLDLVDVQRRETDYRPPVDRATGEVIEGTKSTGPVNPERPEFDRLRAEVLVVLADGPRTAEYIADAMDAELHRVEQLLVAMTVTNDVVGDRGLWMAKPTSRP